ncbi:MAG: hypothetical protein VYA60_05210 [Pseudomonadota bacterium]|nr:hypothetical protein [Pseudomonadota bacterium]|tara:strand:- start:519 stop:1019 length:501 start_codon:yes stop_codon:yes gene_type:complete
MAKTTKKRIAKTTGKALITAIKAGLKSRVINTGNNIECTIGGYGREQPFLSFTMPMNDEVIANFDIEMGEYDDTGKLDDNSGGTHRTRVVSYKKLTKITYQQKSFRIGSFGNRQLAQTLRVDKAADIKDIDLLDDYLKSVFDKFRVFDFENEDGDTTEYAMAKKTA